MNYKIIFPALIFMISCNTSNQKGKTTRIDSLNYSKAVEYSCIESEKAVFKVFLNDLKLIGYIPQTLKKWSSSYKNHITQGSNNEDSTLIVLPEDQVWLGIKQLQNKHNRETTDIRFLNTVITETVVKGSKKGSFGGDIKIVQFLFKDIEDAQNSIDNMKLISYYTINTDGLKNPNFWWIHNCAIYFCRTRSAATSIKPIWETFQEKYGEIQLMRW